MAQFCRRRVAARPRERSARIASSSRAPTVAPGRAAGKNPPSFPSGERDVAPAIGPGVLLKETRLCGCVARLVRGGGEAVRALLELRLVRLDRGVLEALEARGALRLLGGDDGVLEALLPRLLLRLVGLLLGARVLDAEPLRALPLLGLLVLGLLRVRRDDGDAEALRARLLLGLDVLRGRRGRGLGRGLGGRRGRRGLLGGRGLRGRRRRLRRRRRRLGGRRVVEAELLLVERL